MSKHTPTPTGKGTGIPELPWALYPSACEGYVYVGTAATTDEGPGYPVEFVLGEPIPLAFGELILRVCNSHDSLVAACKEAQGAITQLRSEHENFCEDLDEPCEPKLVLALIKLAAALGKAKETT